MSEPPRLKQITENRRLNLAEQFAQYETLESWPLHVALPTGDRCNLHCVFCTDRGPEVSWYQDQTFEEFLRFVGPASRALMVQLYGWGEPLVNPAYPQMFDYVTQRFAGTRLYISTNGVLLTDRWIDRILAYGKCLVNISLNAATPQTYAQLTGHDLFRRVVRNVRKLTRARAKARASELVVTLSLAATRLNIHELPRFVELSDDLDIRFIILQDLSILEDRHLQLYLGEEMEEAARSRFLEAAELARSRGLYFDSFMHLPGTYFEQDRTECAQIELPRDCLSIWEQDDDPPFHPENGECYEPWITFLVSQNGDVTTCCRAREVMGNLLEQGFEEIWNGPVYRTYRRTLNTFRPPEACRGCPVKTGHDVR